MKIKNKATGAIVEVTEMKWSNMIYEGTAKKYEVMPVIEPKGFYKGEGVIEKGDVMVVDEKGDVETFQLTDEPTREEMIEALREQGHTVAHNIGDDKLLTRYKENV